MKLKNKKNVEYTLNGEKKTIEVFVELKQIEGTKKEYQNVWYAKAYVDDQEIQHSDLNTCVNVEHMCDHILGEEIEKLRKEHGRSLRIKRNVKSNKKKRK